MKDQDMKDQDIKELFKLLREIRTLLIKLTTVVVMKKV